MEGVLRIDHEKVNIIPLKIYKDALRNLMMIEFIIGQADQVAASENQEWITEILQTCDIDGSFAKSLNLKYNNAHHFGTDHAPRNIVKFLKDLQHAAISLRETVQVMGDVHTGIEHYSMCVGQYDEEDQFHAARVRDRYISIRLAPNRCFMPYTYFRSNVTYHLLIDTPETTWLEL